MKIIFNFKLKKSIAILLICIFCLTMVMDIQQSNANPAIAAYVPYVATIMVAAGLTFATQEDYTVVVNDWWAEQSDTVKNLVLAGVAGAVCGISFIDDMLWNSIRDYTKTNFVPGANTKLFGQTEVVLDYDSEILANESGIHRVITTDLSIDIKYASDRRYIQLWRVDTNDMMSQTDALYYGAGLKWTGWGIEYFNESSDLICGYLSDGRRIRLSQVRKVIPGQHYTTGGTTKTITGQSGVDTVLPDYEVYDPATDGWWKVELDYTNSSADMFPVVYQPNNPLPNPAPKRMIGLPIPFIDINGDPTPEALDNPKNKNQEDVKPKRGTPLIPIPIPWGLPGPNPNPFPEPEVNPSPVSDPNPTINTTPNPDGTSTTSLPDIITDIITDSKKDPDTGERTKNELNLDPLKLVGTAFTWKFPFCLPWDILRAFQEIGNSGTDAPVFQIPVAKQFGLTGDMVGMEVDLNNWNDVAAAVRSIEAFIFGIGLVLVTRKLMGGDV